MSSVGQQSCLKCQKVPVACEKQQLHPPTRWKCDLNKILKRKLSQQSLTHFRLFLVSPFVKKRTKFIPNIIKFLQLNATSLHSFQSPPKLQLLVGSFSSTGQQLMLRPNHYHLCWTVSSFTSPRSIKGCYSEMRLWHVTLNCLHRMGRRNKVCWKWLLHISGFYCLSLACHFFVF